METPSGYKPEAKDRVNQFPTEEEIRRFLGRRFKKDGNNAFLHTNKSTGRNLFLIFPSSDNEGFALDVLGGSYINIPNPREIILQPYDSEHPKGIVVESPRGSFFLETRNLTAWIEIFDRAPGGRNTVAYIPLGEELNSPTQK